MNKGENMLEMRRKVGHYSYLSRDVIGKGYSSVVYRAQNDSTGTRDLTKDKQSPSN